MPEGRARPVDSLAVGRAPDAETLVLPPGAADAVDAVPGRQVRLYADGDPTLFTVVDGDVPHPTVSAGGAERLGTTDGVRLSAQAVNPWLARETAATLGEFVERVRPGDDRLVACAPHGGMVEPGTGEQARRVGSRTGATVWWCAGWHPGGGAFDRWHVSSTALHGDSFPGLGRLLRRPHERAVAFHGWRREGIGVGGGAPRALRVAVRDALDEALPCDVWLVTGGQYAGVDPENVVNRLARAGVQLEQGRTARVEHPAAVADAVAAALAGTTSPAE